MARGQIIVDTSRLITVAGQVDTYADTYKRTYEALYKKVDDLKSQSIGKDNDKFTTQIYGFQDDFQRMEKLMRDYAEYLRKSAAALKETEDKLTTEAGRLSTGS